jgi:hypothetical protein
MPAIDGVASGSELEETSRDTASGTAMQHMISMQVMAVASEEATSQLRVSTMPFDSLQHGVRRLVGHQPRSQLDAGTRRHYRLDALTCKVKPPSWQALSDVAVCDMTKYSNTIQQKTGHAALAQPKSPVKPPQKPTASSVGRNQVRAVVEYPCRVSQEHAAQHVILKLSASSHRQASTSI